MEEEKSGIYATNELRKISEGEYEPRKLKGFPYDLNSLCKLNFNFDFGFEALKDSIEWLAKRQSDLELRVQDISDIATAPPPIVEVEKPPPIKIETHAPIIEIIERKPDYEITPEDLNKLEKMLKS